MKLAVSMELDSKDLFTGVKSIYKKIGLVSKSMGVSVRNHVYRNVKVYNAIISLTIFFVIIFLSTGLRYVG